MGGRSRLPLVPSLALVGLSVSGVRIGNLTRLAAYRPWIVAATLAVLSYGYRLSCLGRSSCAAAGSCARPLSDRFVRTGLVVATLLVAAELGFDLIAPLFLHR
ncbi:MAG: mercury transporter MerT [Bradyrhizobiaceae bacterium PARB1]|nr:MAG: mercury transporter MerT [Bradyrhizobiaceae bacterium PARB1]